VENSNQFDAIFPISFSHFQCEEFFGEILNLNLFLSLLQSSIDKKYLFSSNLLKIKGNEKNRKFYRMKAELKETAEIFGR